MNDTDDDIRYNGTRELIDHLQKIDLLDLDEGRSRVVVDHIILLLNPDLKDIVAVALRAIVLLPAHLHVEFIPNLFLQLFNVAYDDQCVLRSAILSSTREIIMNSVSFSEDRQLSVKESIFNRIQRELPSSSSDALYFTIQLLSSLLESLGDLFSGDEIKSVLTFFQHKVECDDSDIISALCELAKPLAVKVPVDQFIPFITFLESKVSCFNVMQVLFSMLTYKPTQFDHFAKSLTDIFLLSLNAEEESFSALLSDDPDADPSHYITVIHGCISSMNSLLSAFPGLISDEVNDLCHVVFKYLTYNTLVTEDDTTNLNEEIGEDIDADIDEADEQIIIGDDSWKIRKSAMHLFGTLIKNYEFEIGDVLLEDSNIDQVYLMIRDLDDGALKEGIMVLQLIVSKLTSKVGLEYVYYWINTVCGMLNTTRLNIISCLLNCLFKVTETLESLPVELTHTCFECLKINESIVGDAVRLLTIFIKTQSIAPDDAPRVAELLEQAISLSQSHSMAPVLQAVALFFQNIDAVDRLNEVVLPVIDMPGEGKVTAIFVEGTYIVATQGEAQSREAFAAILHSLVEPGTTLAALQAFSLILKKCISCDGVVDLIRQNLKQIEEGLFKIIEKPIDFVVEKTALNDVYYLIRNGMITLPISMLNRLMAIIDVEDSIAAALALKILTYVDDVNEVIDHLRQRLVTMECDQYLQRCALEFLKAHADLVDGFVEKLLCNENEEFNVQIASIIGKLGNQRAFDFARNQIMENQEKVRPFYIIIIGHLGTVIDLSNDEVVGVLFDLAKKSEERAIFSAASEAMGHLAVKAPAVLPQIISESTSNPQKRWIIAFSGYIQNCESDTNLSMIYEYLIHDTEVPDDSQEAVAQCLYGIISRKNDLILQIADIVSHTHSSIACCCARALGLYMPQMSDEIAAQVIDLMINGVVDEYPKQNGFILQCLKRFVQRFGTENTPASNAYQVVEQSTVYLETHKHHLFQGMEDEYTDVGKLQRMTAVEILELYVNEFTPSDRMVRTLINAIDDPQNEVKMQVFNVLAKVARYGGSMTQSVVDHLEEIAKILNEQSRIVFAEHDANELQYALLRVVCFIRSVTEKQKNVELERIAQQHKDDQRMMKIRDEIAFTYVQADKQKKWSSMFEKETEAIIDSKFSQLISQ